MTQKDVDDLIRRLKMAAQQTRHVPGRGDPEFLDSYRVILTDAERKFLIEAIDTCR